MKKYMNIFVLLFVVMIVFVYPNKSQAEVKCSCEKISSDITNSIFNEKPEVDIQFFRTHNGKQIKYAQTNDRVIYIKAKVWPTVKARRLDIKLYKGNDDEPEAIWRIPMSKPDSDGVSTATKKQYFYKTKVRQVGKYKAEIYYGEILIKTFTYEVKGASKTVKVKKPSFWLWF